MFFIMSSGKVFHKLEDKQDGHAPLPCGAQLDKYSLWMLHQGKPTRNVVEEIPPDAILCKKCASVESGDC